MTVHPDAGTEQGQARCYRHPMRETGVRCVRCDRPICPDCMRPASVGFQCPDDVKLGAATQRAPLTIAGARAQALPPYCTWGLIAVNVIVYLVTVLQSHDGINEPVGSRLFQQWELVPRLVALDHQYDRLLTSMFLHESVLHIGANMVALYLVGPHLERLLGPWRYVSLYLLAGLGGSVAVYAFDSKYVTVVGASGAIYGLFAACLLFVRELGFDPRWLVATIVVNFVLTVTIPDISKLGHLGGFVIGAAAACAIGGLPWRRRRLPPRLQLAGLSGIAVILLALVIWRTIVL
jgi:membrane associated rhomboid family serine protease